jgi:hypothetical protein
VVQDDDAGAGARRRLAAAALVAALFGGLILAVLLARSGSGAGAAPAECVESWNRLDAATSIGRHSYTGHGYRQTQVRFLSDRGAEVSEDAPEARCAVVFPAETLDPEPNAAAYVRRGGWVSLGELGVDTDRLAELQREAVTGSNAGLRPDGTLSGP